MPRPSLSRPLRAALVLAFLATFAALSVLSLARKSITTDEVPHIAAGYSCLKTGSFRINPEHPPLSKSLAGLALLFLDPVLDTGHETWIDAAQDQGIEFGFHFHFDTPENLARHRTLLFWARLPMVLVGLVFCLYMYLLARLLYGQAAAFLVLVLAALSPTVIAHARLVTTDVTLTAFWVGATYHMIRFLRKPTWMQLLLCGLTTGLAMAAKFSGIFALATIWFVAAASFLARGGPWSRPAETRLGADLAWRAARWCLHLGVLTAIAFAVVAALYFGHEFGRYFEGFGKVFANHDPRYRAFFFGGHYAGIIWPYYVMALLVKLPLGTLVLAAIGFLWRPRTGEPLTWRARLLLGLAAAGPAVALVAQIAWTDRLPVPAAPATKLLLLAALGLWLAGAAVLLARKLRPGPAWVERLLLVVPALLIFVISTISGKYLGVRYVLPCLPLLLLLAGRTMTLSWTRRLPGRLVPVALALAVAVSTVLGFPHYLSYFNEAVGGRRGGAHLLDDSNIDWGQDWIEVAEFQQHHGIESLGYWPHNRIDPCAPYGIRGTVVEEEELYLPRPGWYAIGAHTLNRDYLYSYDRPIRYDWLRRYEPVALVGGATYVFRFWLATPESPPPADFRGTVFTPQQRREEGLERLQRARTLRPDSAGIHQRLARLLAEMARPEEARASVEACLETSGATVERALTVIAAIDMRQLTWMTVAERNRFLMARHPRFLELHDSFVELLLAADTACTLVDPDLAIRCIESAQRVLASLERIPPTLVGLTGWPNPVHDRYFTTQLLAIEHARRHVLRGSDADARAVRDLADAANRMARQIGLQDRLDPDRILAEQRRDLGPAAAPEKP